MIDNYVISDLHLLEQRFRACFINSIGGFKSLILIGTRSKSGNTNLAVFSSFFHIGANPPLFGIIIRPGSDQRHTLHNILETGVFTVNHVMENFLDKAHQSSARYPANVSEFDATGLQEQYIENFYAPFVNESNVKIGAVLREKSDLAINNTTLVIAEIKFVSIPEDCLSADGFVNLEKAGTITCSGLDSYHHTKQISRLSYAKPGTWPHPL